MTDSYSEALVAHALATYDARLERPWKRHPGYGALMHADDGKMFALLANVAASSLGLEGGGRFDIVTVQMGDPLLAEALPHQPGHFRGHPLKRGGWVTISLEGDVPFEDICG